MHTSEEEDLWDMDPAEYMRYRYDSFEGKVLQLCGLVRLYFLDMHSPSAAASQLLQVMSRRVGVLLPTLEFTLSRLTPESSSHDIDASLHMISVLAPTLHKNKVYSKIFF